MTNENISAPTDMTNENVNTPRNERHTWLEPGAWRKPCIVHVTMVANARQALFGKLSHNGSEAVIEKTPIGWALINQQRRLLGVFLRIESAGKGRDRTKQKEKGTIPK